MSMALMKYIFEKKKEERILYGWEEDDDEVNDEG